MIRLAGGEASRLVGADLAEFMAEPLHLAIEHEGNVALFAWRGPGIYEVHVHFQARGRVAIEAMHAILGHVRTDHGGKMFWALIPVESRHVRMFARLMGWSSHGVMETRGGPNELFVSEG